jgi:hypothetical protein
LSFRERHVGEKNLASLQIENSFFDRVVHDNPLDFDGTSLTKSVSTIERLSFDRFAPS